MGMRDDEKIYLLTNLSKMVGFNLVNLFFLIDYNILAYHYIET